MNMAPALHQSLTLPAGSPLSQLIERDPARLGGEPLFRGTRVPIKSLFDHLIAGDTLATFLEDFPGVTSDQARAVLELAAAHLLQGMPPR